MQPGNEIAPYNNLDTGLEDLGVEDLRMPRLVIDHKKGVFRDSLSGAEYEKLNVITLGLVKQRVLWHATVQEEAASPLCKSTNFMVGYPTMNKPKPSDNFPWQAAGWQPSDFQPDEYGRITLPCDSCRLAQWKSHPDGKKTWCSEQHAVPLLYGPEGTVPSMTAIFTTQRSSIAATRTYFAGIARQNLPAYAFIARLSLSAQKRGVNIYYVPVFTALEQTSQENWPTWSENYRSIREFLQRPPALRDAEGNIIDVNSLAQANVIQGQVAQPAPQQAVQQTVVQQPVVQQPVVQQPVIQQQVTLPPTPPGATMARDDDDLPF